MYSVEHLMEERKVISNNIFALMQGFCKMEEEKMEVIICDLILSMSDFCEHMV